MLELLKRGVFTGVGLGLLARDKIEEMAKTISEEAQLSEEQGRKLFESMLKQSEEAKESLQARIDQAIQDALAKMAVATREDVQGLDERLTRLEKLSRDTGCCSGA